MFNKIIIQLVVIAVFLPALFGCDMVYRMLDKKGAEEKKLIGEIIPYERNEIVAEVQRLLYVYGYNTGKVDGILGLRTRNAIEKFQIDNGLEASRFIDQETWLLLKEFDDLGLVDEGKLNVAMVQSLLHKAGFDPGSIDGKMGSRTSGAVLKFQEAHELKVDGKIGYQTLKSLISYLELENN